MSDKELLLVAIMETFPFKWQRKRILKSFILHYGSISLETRKKARVLIKEGEDK